MNPRITSIENLIASDPGDRNIFGLVVADQLHLAAQSLRLAKRVGIVSGFYVAEAGAGESVVASAEIDLGALRRFRRRPGMQNLLSRQRFEAYAETYSSLSFYPADNLEGRQPSREHFLRTQRETIERLAKLGVI